jgi:CBS domain-containing protein
MTARGVNRLPVVEGGRLVGIVTRADLVRAYVRSDDELAETIREDVLYRILCLDPARFTVAVRDGIVSLGGSVERRSTAELAERAVAMVPGIVRLDANVAWIIDDTQPQPGVEWAVPLGTR